MILFRYLAREIFVSVIAVSATLLLVVMSGRFVKYLAQAASGELAPDVLFLVMFYRLPNFLELVLPMGMFIGILLAYGRLYVDSEMGVMSACGFSTARLTAYTLSYSLLVAALVGSLSLYASPLGIARVQELFQDISNTRGLDSLISGRFRVDDKSGRVTYIESLSKDRHEMYQVFSAEQHSVGEQGASSGVVFAEKGRIEMRGDGANRYLVLENGYRYQGQAGGLEFDVTRFARYGQLLRLSPVERKARKADAKQTAELLASEQLEDRAALQWRLSLVALVPVIALLAQALSRTNHRRGRYVKMLPAFLLYIIYLVMLNAGRDALVKQKLPMELGLWWIHALFLLLALVLLFGGDGWRRWRARAG